MNRITWASVAALALSATPALAGGWLDGVARQVAGQAIQQGANAALSGAFSGKKKKPKPGAEEQTATPAPVAPVAQVEGVSSEDPFAEPGAPVAVGGAAAGKAGGLAPWPTNAGARLKRPGQLTFAPSVKTDGDAFREFSRYSCTDCEGGHGYDAWARHFLSLDGSFHAFEKKVGALVIGQSLTWKGRESDGAIAVVAEGTVAGFQCKQVKWTMKKRKGGASASRDGLFCLGKADDYSASDTWNEAA